MPHSQMYPADNEMGHVGSTAIPPSVLTSDVLKVIDDTWNLLATHVTTLQKDKDIQHKGGKY